MSPVSKHIITGCLLLFLTGCLSAVPAPGPPRRYPPTATIPVPPEEFPSEEPAPDPLPPETPEAPRQAPTPRALASLELSRQAQIFIEEDKLDEAIRILEQAVNLHPGSGENYYYLAEAWRRKGNLSQASEYNNLAAIRFKDDAEWTGRIARQKRRIDRIRK